METEIYKPRPKKSRNRSILKRSKNKLNSRRRRSKRHSRRRRSSVRKKSRKKSRRRRSSVRKKSRRRRSSVRKKSRKKRSSVRKKSRKKSRRRRSRRRRSNKRVTFSFSSDIIPNKTITIYGMNGCPACEKSKKMCKEKNVHFNYYIRSEHEDKVQKIAPGYKYVPVVVDENDKFIGGSIELEKYLKNK